MLEKIKEDADKLYKDYLMLLQSSENTPKSQVIIDVEENIKRHMSSVYSISKLVGFPEEIILEAVGDVENIEKFSEKMNNDLKFYQESYKLFVEELNKTKTF